MRFDVHLRQSVRTQIAQLANEMKAWEEEPRIDEAEEAQLRDRIMFFTHTTKRENLRIAGVDGSGDFPAVSYADSFVYVTVAQGTTYESSPVSGLKEIGPLPEPLVHFAWIPEDEDRRRQAFDDAFAFLAGQSVSEVIEKSDYHTLKAGQSRRAASITTLEEQLIRPHASDSGNIAIQLRSAGEFGAALRLIRQEPRPDYVLVDTTFSLPSLSLPTGSLFYEHLKRLCCVEARNAGVGFFALSKSHSLPAIQQLEQIAGETGEIPEGQIAEHWYLRLPVPGIDHWTLSLAKGRRLPPQGAVTYLFRFHHNTPVMRLDMDHSYWQSHVRGNDESETKANERRILSDLDYASHDQRAYGYPYPIKASHDRASMTRAERVALRKQIIDAAVQAGMKRALFRDVSQATGHG